MAPQDSLPKVYNFPQEMCTLPQALQLLLFFMWLEMDVCEEGMLWIGAHSTTDTTTTLVVIELYV
jgi:hypothetical protein